MFAPSEICVAVLSAVCSLTLDVAGTGWVCFVVFLSLSSRLKWIIPFYIIVYMRSCLLLTLHLYSYNSILTETLTPTCRWKKHVPNWILAGTPQKMIRKWNDINKVELRKLVVVPKLRRLVARFSTQWHEFDMGFEVGKVAVG